MTVVKQMIASNPNIEGAYPRWITLASIINPKDPAAGQTGSFLIFGVISFFILRISGLKD